MNSQDILSKKKHYIKKGKEIVLLEVKIKETFKDTLNLKLCVCLILLGISYKM